MIEPIASYSHSGPVRKLRVFWRASTALLDRRFVGRVFGGYKLEKALGAGRFATCFLACRETGDACVSDARRASDCLPSILARLFSFPYLIGSDSPISGEGKRVVMKLVKPQRGRVDMQAVWAECSALQACSHPAIPEWLGIVNMGAPGAEPDWICTAGGRKASDSASSRSFFASFVLRSKPYFIVESCMPGRSLAHWLQKDCHAFGMDEIRAIGLQLIGVLEHLEQHGIVHGDLRPANVLYDGQRVSVIDFGLSCRACASSQNCISPGAADAIDVSVRSAVVACSPRAMDDFAADRDGLASVLLFLLYSDESRVKPGVKATWREELILPDSLRQFLEGLFNESYSRENCVQIRTRFEQVFVPGE